MFKTILVPTDGSTVAESAIGPAIEFAKSQHARIVALSVAEPVPMVMVPGAEFQVLADQVDESELLAKAQAAVRVVAAAARAADVPCTAVAMLAPQAYEAIIRTAKERHCDLIIMATHGRRGIQRLVMGGQTQKVLLGSPVPVLVCRPPAAA